MIDEPYQDHSGDGQKDNSTPHDTHIPSKKAYQIPDDEKQITKPQKDKSSQ